MLMTLVGDWMAGESAANECNWTWKGQGVEGIDQGLENVMIAVIDMMVEIAMTVATTTARGIDMTTGAAMTDHEVVEVADSEEPGELNSDWF